MRLCDLFGDIQRFQPRVGGNRPMTGGNAQAMPFPMATTGGNNPAMQAPWALTGGGMPASPMPMVGTGGSLPPQMLRPRQRLQRQRFDYGNGYASSGVNTGGMR